MCHLKKPMYGLKQLARNWNVCLHEVLTSMSFTRCKADQVVYIYLQDKDKIIVPIFIDDITLARTSPAANDKVIDELKSHFKLCDLGPTDFLLGIHITHDTLQTTRSPCHNDNTLQTYSSALGCLSVNCS